MPGEDVHPVAISRENARCETHLCTGRRSETEHLRLSCFWKGMRPPRLHQRAGSLLESVPLVLGAEQRESISARTFLGSPGSCWVSRAWPRRAHRS